MAIRGYITLTLEVSPEGKQFVGRCRELGITSCGGDVAATFENETQLLRLRRAEAPRDPLEQRDDRRHLAGPLLTETTKEQAPPLTTDPRAQRAASGRQVT